MRLAVVGGGAAGYFAAITAALEPDTHVTVFEAGSRPLVKVGISGGGRCNVTHACFDPARLVGYYPRGGRELLGPFTRFGPRETVAWFESLGVALKTEEDGRMFPATDLAQTVVDCLRKTAERAGVALFTRSRVTGVERDRSAHGSPVFKLQGSGHSERVYDRVLLAAGGSPQGHRIAAALGHTIVPCVPSLFSFVVHDPRLAGLAGVSFADVELRLQPPAGPPLTRRGPLLITHWGVSGPAVLWLSAWGARALNDGGYKAELRLNFLPERKPSEVAEVLQARRRDRGAAHPQGDVAFALPRRYWSRICAAAGIDGDATWAHVKQVSEGALIQELVAARFAVSGKGEFKEEFVTCGGVDLKEVDFRTLESRRCPGLYFAGEILDIDGVTGGFNFQSAWTTGYLAGLAMARPNTAPASSS